MAVKKVRIDRLTHRKAYFVLIFFTVASLVILFKLFNMQILSYEEYQKSVLEQMTTEVEVNPERGDIYDTNGNVLATNVTRYLVFISPQDIIDAMTELDEDEVAPVFTWDNFEGYREVDLPMNKLIAKFLSGLIEGVEYDKVMELAAKEGRRYEVVAKEINEEQANTVREFIEEYDLYLQIHLEASAVRYYPYNSLAAHVIGFTDVDGKGIYGIEHYYNNIMEGKNGRYITAQDAHHNDMPFEYETFIEAEDGYNPVTTLDVNIQYELENQLENALNDHKAANRVCGIVMDVETGGVLAMATGPSFDLNEPRELDELSLATLAEYSEEYPEGSKEYNLKRLDLLYAMWKNKTITETYEPGSTFKILTTAMCLEEKKVSLSDTFYCSGALKVDGYASPIHCHKREGHGLVSFSEGLQQSCNPTMMTIAQRLGQRRFYDYFEQFGYRELTGIDLPGETGLIGHEFSDFSIPSLAVYSFGQTFKTTPIQQLTAICAVANGGYLVTPHVLKEVVDDDGNVIENYETDVKRQVVSTETCETITKILEEGVSGDGGARNAYVKGYKVAAKTGTSEKRDKLDENGEKSLRIGSCVAYAPADDPKVAVLIMVDEPSAGSVYGSVVAAPYVSNLLSFILPYMGYEPTYTEEEMQSVEVTLSNYVGSTVEKAKSDLEWREIGYKIVGDGDKITSQTPAAGSQFTKQHGVVYLYTGDSTALATVEVPDLVGKSAEAANRMVTNSGLNIKISGATGGTGSTVTSQTPAPGTKVAKGELVTITMIHKETSDG